MRCCVGSWEAALASPLREGQLFAQSGAQYALLAFLFVPALILAVVALFWVPPRLSGGGPVTRGATLANRTGVDSFGGLPDWTGAVSPTLENEWCSPA